MILLIFCSTAKKWRIWLKKLVKFQKNLSRTYGTTLKTANMTPYNFGDIVLVPFPFTDQSTTKKRPAVVVSSFPYNVGRNDLIIMAITSRLHQIDKLGEKLVIDWQGAGLLKPSVFKPILATIMNTLVLKQLGSLKDQDCHNLTSILQDIIGKRPPRQR